jgi:hypothetical protein
MHWCVHLHPLYSLESNTTSTLMGEQDLPLPSALSALSAFSAFSALLVASAPLPSQSFFYGGLRRAWTRIACNKTFVYRAVSSSSCLMLR